MQEIAPRSLASWPGDEPLLLLDVREAWEVAVSPFPDATHVPMREIPSRIDELPQQRTIVCICHHGARSAQVALFLQHRGFERVYNLSGGIDAWAREVDSTVVRY
ncbi:MAG: rhodanese-like domain-containing protein [Burkholderiaceae bacterium]|jgi:rhodanese-related sulfurtransferase|nr:rhodanese-like domain-containing protein [Burkholderiaceae bacterium]